MHKKGRPVNHNLFTKLRQLRTVCGYSQEAVAMAWNVSQAAVSKLESGKSVLTFERVEQAASLYKLTIDELMHDDCKTLRVKALQRQ